MQFVHMTLEGRELGVDSLSKIPGRLGRLSVPTTFWISVRVSVTHS